MTEKYNKVLQSNEYSENLDTCLSSSSSLICHKKNGIGYPELSISVSLQRAEQLIIYYIRKFVNIKKIQKLSGSNISVQSPLHK